MSLNLRPALRIRPHTALLSPGSSLWPSRSYSSWLSVHPGSVYYSLSPSLWGLNFIAHNHCTMLLCYIRTFLQKYDVWWAHPSILPLSPFHTSTPVLFRPLDSLTNFMSYIQNIGTQMRENRGYLSLLIGLIDLTWFFSSLNQLSCKCQILYHHLFIHFSGIDT